MRLGQECSGISKQSLGTSAWFSFPMVIGATTTAPTKGTVVLDQARWRKNGPNMEIVYNYRQTGAGSAGSGTYLFPIPGGHKADTDVIPAAITNFEGACGPAMITNGLGCVAIHDTSNLMMVIVSGASAAYGTIGDSFGGFANAILSYSFYASVPIVAWRV